MLSKLRDIALTRQEPFLISEDLDPEEDRNFSGRGAEIFPAESERMELEAMLKGYTISCITCRFMQ